MHLFTSPEFSGSHVGCKCGSDDLFSQPTQCRHWKDEKKLMDVKASSLGNLSEEIGTIV